MATEPAEVGVQQVHQTVFVDAFTDGLLGPENRAAIAGAIEIGRAPGVVRVTFRAPAGRREACRLLRYAVEQYGEHEGAAVRRRRPSQ